MLSGPKNQAGKCTCPGGAVGQQTEGTKSRRAAARRVEPEGWGQSLLGALGTSALSHAVRERV